MSLLQVYLNGMATVGKRIPKKEVRVSNATDSGGSEGDLANESSDQIAYELGNQYRSLGILIGVFGIALVLLSIAPIGLRLPTFPFEIVRLILMAMILAAFFFGQYSSLKSRWINSRMVAERLRYRALEDAIAKHESSKYSLETGNLLRVKLAEILWDGQQGQITYNENKAATYEAIIRLGNALIWFSFISGLVGLAGAMLIPNIAWIFLTAFVPAAVGGIHGINGFLGIHGMAEQHREMSVHLAELGDRLKQLEQEEASNGTLLNDLALVILHTLNSRDAQWEKAAKRLKLKLA